LPHRRTPRRQRPVLLTVTGAIGAGNRGKLDPVRDQMMVKQKLSFDKAYGFDFAALAALPAISIKPTLEYDGKPHTLRGPLLLDVMKAAGAKLNDNTRLVLRAIDGFAATVTVAQARRSATSWPPIWMAHRWRWAAWGRCGPCMTRIKSRKWRPSRSPTGSAYARGACTTSVWIKRRLRPGSSRVA
jgi:hypothetical protein